LPAHRSTPDLMRRVTRRLSEALGAHNRDDMRSDLERELKAVGTANLLSAGFSGYVSCISLSRTTLNYGLGGRDRLSGLTVAVISAVILIVGSDFLTYVPKFVLGGLLSAS
jgi:SulP family sulfate permease